MSFDALLQLVPTCILHNLFEYLEDPRDNTSNVLTCLNPFYPLLENLNGVSTVVVMKNLIGNALKFTEKGSVDVRARQGEDGVEFSISDTGPGIAPDLRETIFESYRRVGGGERQDGEGIGLGLYIVRQLLNMLGGKISLESEMGRGSTFRVRIPWKAHA